MEFLQLMINGLLLGSVYALLGIGMNMIFGIIRLTNLAHGEFVVLGAYAAALVTQRLHVDPLFSLIVTVPLMLLLGFVLQLFLFNPAMKRGSEPALLVTFGVSIILQDLLLLLFSADAQHISVPYSLTPLSLGSLEISMLNILLFLVSLCTILLLTWFLRKTYAGRAIRAIADDREAAALAGINVRRIYGLAMGISMATAAVAGLCVGLKWTFYPSSGGSYLLIAFIVVVIGGLGNIPGTLLAGFLFGLAQVIGGANYGLLISYILLLTVLVIRPQGLVAWGRKGG